MIVVTIANLAKKLTGALVLALALSGCSKFQTSLAGSSSLFSQSPSGEALVSWHSVPGGQTGFTIEQSSDGQSYSQIQQVPDGTNSVIIGGLKSGQTYYFRMRSYNQTGFSPYTQVAAIVVN